MKDVNCVVQGDQHVDRRVSFGRSRLILH